MSKKKRKDLISQMFDKKADITTTDKTQYHIRKVRIYDCKTNYYGKMCVISSKKYNKNNLHVIREFYDTPDDDRIHVRLCRITNVKMIKTIEKTPEGKERKILLLNDYDNSSEYIHSIGPIKEFKSDLITDDHNHKFDNIKILQLVLKRQREEHNKKVA